MVDSEKVTFEIDMVLDDASDDLPLALHETMFFFSYWGHGYVLYSTRLKSEYPDLVTVLESFTFDHKEEKQQSSVY